MSNPTSNFGWQMPTPTDLVTDLPADFEVFGQAVDTTLADLKGGTAGQMLTKATNTDMDFTWVTPEIGDITAVNAGTGLSGGGTTGSVTLAIDSTVTTNSGSQTLTNKNLTSATNTFPSSLVTLTDTQTLTNKTLTAPVTTVAFNNQTGTTYTPVLTDADKIVTLNNASAISVTIPTNASVAYPIGTKINFAWITGAGQPTISAVTPATTTILSTGATSTAPKLRLVNSMATAIKIDTDKWLISGDIS